MSTTTVTQKGQVTIPIKYRKRFGMKTNSMVRISEVSNGIKIELVKDAESLAGILHNPNKKPLSIDELVEIRSKGVIFNTKK